MHVCYICTDHLTNYVYTKYKYIYMYPINHIYKNKRITCRIVTPNLNGVIILQVESYLVTVVQVVNICLNHTIQDIICSIGTNLWRKTNEAGNSLNDVEREPVQTKVLNPTASEASYKPKQRSYGKTKLKKTKL